MWNVWHLYTQWTRTRLRKKYITHAVAVICSWFSLLLLLLVVVHFPPITSKNKTSRGPVCVNATGFALRSWFLFFSQIYALHHNIQSPKLARVYFFEIVRLSAPKSSNRQMLCRCCDSNQFSLLFVTNVFLSDEICFKIQRLRHYFTSFSTRKSQTL